MACEYCEKGKLNTLIKSEKIGNMIWWSVGHELKKECIDEVDNSVVLEIRCGQGYLRLGDRSDMQCIDHDEKIKIFYCPVCGRKLK